MSLSAFPSLDTFRADAARVAPVLYSDAPLTRVTFHYSDGTKLPLSMTQTYPPPPPNEASDLPTLTAKQRNMLISLRDDGSATGEVLAERLGYSGASSLHAKKGGTGGVRDLIEGGLVYNDEEEGYRLTGFGKDVAARLGDH